MGEIYAFQNIDLSDGNSVDEIHSLFEKKTGDLKIVLLAEDRKKMY